MSSLLVKIYRFKVYEIVIKQIEEKSKFVAAAWGTEFMQFHAKLQI